MEIFEKSLPRIFLPCQANRCLKNNLTTTLLASNVQENLIKRIVNGFFQACDLKSAASGATVATVGVFLIPWVLSVLASNQVQRYVQHPWLQGFGVGAAPAVIGLLGITVFALGRYAFSDWLYWVIAALALGLSLFTRTSPILILMGGTVFGALFGPLLPD